MAFNKQQKHWWYLQPHIKKKLIKKAAKWAKENPIPYSYSRYKRNAKNRNLCFLLSKTEFAEITSQPCFYCGKLQENFNGIDRFDNLKGYEKENCVPCCKICNQMKHASSVQNFLEQCKQITKKQELGN